MQYERLENVHFTPNTIRDYMYTLLQSHRSRYSRCSGHWIITILGLVLGCWTLHFHRLYQKWSQQV